MEFIKRLFFCVFLFGSVNCFAKKRRVLNFLTVNYCPMICKDGVDKGIIVDILHSTFSSKNFDVRVHFVPIKRAFLKSNKKNYDGFLGGNKNQLKGNLFPEFVTVPNIVRFYKHRTSKWKYENLQSLDSTSILSVKDYDHSNFEFDLYLKSKNSKNVVYINDYDHLDQMVSLILRKRYDIFVAGHLALDYFLKDHPKRDEIVPEPKEVGIFKNYISFYPTRKRSKTLLNHFEKEFKKITKNGELALIYKKYGVRGVIREIK